MRVKRIIVTKDFLKSRNVPDIGSIPIFSEDYINESNNLAQKQSKNIIFLEVISSLHQELKSWHDKLPHLHPKYMFRLTKLGVFPSIFIDLKDDVTLFSSCMFGIERRSKRRTKGKQ